MTMVRFATICDRCGARSEEYTAFAMCRECLDDICPNCTQRGSESGGDGEPDYGLCFRCDLVMTIEASEELAFWMSRS